MLFRYRITKSCEWICGSIKQIHYDTKIQRYNPNNMIFKWETCEDTTLKIIIELLSNEYCFSGFENALPEISKTIAKYGSVDKMISEYIQKIIIRDMKLENEHDKIEHELDSIVLTDNWKTIEIKENE